MPAPSPRLLPLIVCDRTVDRHRRLQLVAADAVVAAASGTAATDRTLRGLVLPYAADGRTSAGRVRASAGRVRWSPELRRIKVFVGHDRTRPVGYVTGLAETTVGLTAELHIAATPDGDAALLEAREGTRDALSVELEDVELDDAGELISAELAAIALVPLPAFSDARIAAERDPGDDDDDDTPPAPPPAPGTPPPARAPQRLSAARRRAGLTLDAAMSRVASAIGTSTDANRINAALTDIIPAADTSDGAFIRPQWVDELWTPVNNNRPYVNSVSSGVLTGMTINGWKWGTRPVVGPYAGNKTPIPSGPVTFGPATAAAVRHAGGWDVDRIFVDLGDSSLLTAILSAAAMDYGQKQEAYVSSTLQSEGTPITAAGFMAGLQGIAAELSKIGARPSFIAASSDVWADYTGMKAADAPWWLSSTSSGSVNLTDGSAAAADLRVFVDPTLPPNTVVGGDRRAVTFYEPRGNPFRVQAVNIPNGGVDIGIFGYCAILVNDARGVIVADVTTVP